VAPDRVNTNYTRPGSPDRAWLPTIALLAILGWGVFALGAVRPWGYVPLLAGMAVYGIAALAKRKFRSPVGRGLGLSLVFTCAAVLFQLVPLPAGLLRTFSPAKMADANLDGPVARPISVNPAATVRGFAFLAGLSLLFAGTAGFVSRDGAKRVAYALAALGTLVAIAGIAEASAGWTGLYRALSSQLPPDSMPHGPFPSRNHYAGWMLMCLATTVGALCAGLQSRNMRATSLVALHGAVFVMTIALVQTRSRAGILGVAFAIVAMGVLLAGRVASTRTKVLIATPLAFALMFGIVTAGAQTLATRFSADSWGTAHGRLPVWRQAAAIARDYPLTGSGFNTYRDIVPFYPSADIDEPYEGAHNDYLQLALEGGALVGLPFLMVAACFITEVHQRFQETPCGHSTHWIRIGAVLGVSLMAAQEMVDFSLQIPGNAALFAVLAAIAVHRTHPMRTQHG
jgi:O-antigen ligase